MATAYATFGTAVTIIARSGILRGQEDFAGEMVAQGLRDLGVTIVKAEPERVERTEDGVSITVAGDAIVAEHVLIATDRSGSPATCGRGRARQ